MPDPEVREISYDDLREILEQGFAELMAAMPTGVDPAIKLGYHNGARLLPFNADEPKPLPTLLDFVKAVSTLRRVCRKTNEEIARLLDQEGVAQMIVSEDDAWYQIHVQ